MSAAADLAPPPALVLAPEADDVDVGAAVERYRELGYARLGRVVSEPFLRAIRARADDLMMGRVVHPGLFFQQDSGSGRYEDLPYGQGWVGPSLQYRKLEKLERDDHFRALLENALFERAARLVIAGPIAIYRAVLFNKGTLGGSPLPWHQDGGRFWGLDREPELSIWTALDDAPDGAGCVEVVPHSHRRGLVTPLGGLVPPEHVAAQRPEEHAVALPARAGESILLHNMAWHRSGRNTTAAPRRALSVCYMSAATRCLRKKHAPRTFVRVFEGR